MSDSNEAMGEGHSIRSSQSSLCLDDSDRRYLDALKDKDFVVTKNTRRPLGHFSVVAFILQQVIGTGIFRTPWTTIHASQSVGITLLFWLFGAVTAMAGTVLYIRFGLSLPRHNIDGKKETVVRNGGDLNYVEYLFKRPKFFVDAAARGLAILAVTFPCFLHAFTRRGGILLNNLFVVVKVAILCIFPIMAVCALAGVANTNYAAHNLNQTCYQSGQSDLNQSMAQIWQAGAPGLT
ncbi:hypothetical protein EK21DRAFT_92359 [Setomelanomma holmii]|uniref:Uncharacterized protein n=1 Tax=Setomelanomma holmii TaxID=210430 RepID=A0A9P4LJE9_9PLEO|nr:hypothetical protein EK21DRAFT_92359 [Setomelanomma holmii]